MRCGGAGIVRVSVCVRECGCMRARVRLWVYTLLVITNIPCSSGLVLFLFLPVAF